MDASDNHVTYRGLCFIAKQEACVLVAYQDGKHFSIGFGDNDPGLTMGSTTTLVEAWAKLKINVAARELIVNSMLTVPVQPNQFDALVSAFYQGGSKIRLPIALINAGLEEEAMAMLLSFNRDSTHNEFRLGLAKRRLAEAVMFLRADYGDLSVVKLFSDDPRTTPFTEVPFPPEGV